MNLSLWRLAWGHVFESCFSKWFCSTYKRKGDSMWLLHVANTRDEIVLNEFTSVFWPYPSVWPIKLIWYGTWRTVYVFVSYRMLICIGHVSDTYILEFIKYLSNTNENTYILNKDVLTFKNFKGITSLVSSALNVQSYYIIREQKRK
jgi:hypothetical protein